MQKFPIFERTNLSINMLKITIIVKLETIVIIQVNIEVLHSLVRLKRFL